MCTRESRNLALATVVFDRCIAAPVAALDLAHGWRVQVSFVVYMMLVTRERLISTVPLGILYRGFGLMCLQNVHQSTIKRSCIR